MVRAPGKSCKSQYLVACWGSASGGLALHFSVVKSRLHVVQPLIVLRVSEHSMMQSSRIFNTREYDCATIFQLRCPRLDSCAAGAAISAKTLVPFVRERARAGVEHTAAVHPSEMDRVCARARSPGVEVPTSHHWQKMIPKKWKFEHTFAAQFPVPTKIYISILNVPK